jgi:TatD DNase family protein
MATTLIDAHCHLDLDAFGAERGAVIARAREANLSRMVLIGQWAAPQKGDEDGNEDRSGLWQARETLSLAKSEPAIFSATVGVHPHDAAFATDADWSELAALCALPELVAVGECGLDYHYMRSPKEAQREQFARQLELAKALGKPVVVHSREADQETAEILRAHLGPEGGVIHCFTSDWAAARAYLELGLHISFSGVVTFKTAEATRDAAAQIPLDRILVETDAPFLAPVPMRGKRNEPALVVHTARKLAEVRGISFEEVAEATSANARRALRLP